MWLQSFIKRTESETEDQFNQLSLEERGKFDEETFINVNSIRKRMVAASKGNNRFSNEFIVVSILFDWCLSIHNYHVSS